MLLIVVLMALVFWQYDLLMQCLLLDKILNVEVLLHRSLLATT